MDGSALPGYPKQDADPATARRMIYAWFHEVLSMIEPERRHMRMMALYTMVEPTLDESQTH